MVDMLDLTNIIENNRNTLKNTIELGLTNLQNNFLQTELGGIIDNAVNAGLRNILPNFIEDQVISIKDTILQDGVKAGINEAISSSIDLGKSVIGIFTGNFENVSQIQNAVKKGGLIDSVSSIIDKAIDFAVDTELINKNVGKVISSGKKTILKNISNNIENSLEKQVGAIEKMDKLCENWKAAYQNQDLINMTKEYKNINKQLEKIMPLENTINKAREIENLQKLIENNGGKFDISSEALELAKVL